MNKVLAILSNLQVNFLAINKISMLLMAKKNIFKTTFILVSASKKVFLKN